MRADNSLTMTCRQHVQPCRAVSEDQSTTTAAAAAPAEYVPDNEFSITKISYGSILTPVGLGLMVYGFGSYFTLLPGTDISSILLIYGFPMSILGFALSYAQLEPVKCSTTKAAYGLRASQMTDIQKQIREDTTRYRHAATLLLQQQGSGGVLLPQLHTTPAALQPCLVVYEAPAITVTARQISLVYALNATCSSLCI